MNALQKFVENKPFGFLTEKDMPELIALDRLCLCLVRCGCGRFTCAAQDLAHFIKCVEPGGDYVRDVSLASGYQDRAARWQPEPAPLQAVPVIGHQTDSDDAFGSQENVERHFNQPRHEREFNENDCGGVFDGNQVTSDADPGL